MADDRIAAETCPQCGGPLPAAYGQRLTCPHCGSSLVRLPGAAGAGVDGEAVDGEATGAWGVRLKRAMCMDPKFGVAVFGWLIPADWSFEGTVWWRDSASMPAVIPFRAWNPAGPEQIECFPSLPHMWTETPLNAMLGKWGPKQFKFKMDGVEQRAPMSAQEALVQLVIPRYRGTIAQPQMAVPQTRPGAGLFDVERWQTEIGQLPGLDGLRKLWAQAAGPRYQCPNFSLQLVEQEQLPELGGMLRQTQPQQANGFAPPASRDGARVRVRYTVDGLDMEEDLFCVISRVETQTGFGLLTSKQIFWTAEALFAFRARAGHLDALASACMASMRSFRMNPHWFQCYRQESQRIMQARRMAAMALQQMAASQRQALAGLSDASRTMSETSDMIMDGWAARSSAMDRMGDNLSQAIRGVDTYVDSGGDQVELPSGYDQAWSNGLGEYIVTDSAFYNPNTDQAVNNQPWQTLQRPG